MEWSKQKQREEKREIKRAGSQHRRRAFKRALIEDPESAHLAEEDLGRHASAHLNGLDRDATRRRRDDDEPEPGPESATDGP